MNGTPDVSVIIPTYNRIGYLPACVESVLCQRSSLQVEVIVVDDGSTDATADWARSCGKEIVYVRQENAGQGAARNRGVSVARGELLTFLDSDDLMAKDALESLVAAAREHKADLVVGGWTSFSNNPTHGAVTAPAQHTARTDRAKVVATLPVVSSYIFRHRDVSWNEVMVVNEGVDWILRYVARHSKVICIENVVTHIRQHQSGDRISIANDHYDPENRIEMFDKLRDEFNFSLPNDRDCLRYLDSHVCLESISALRRSNSIPARPLHSNRLFPHVFVGRGRGTGLFILVWLLGLDVGTHLYHSLKRLGSRRLIQ